MTSFRCASLFFKIVNLCIFNYCDSTDVDEIWLVLIPMFHVIFFLYILLELILNLFYII